jgi:hypothetical protein
MRKGLKNTIKKLLWMIFMSDCMCFGYTKWYYEKIEEEVTRWKEE